MHVCIHIKITFVSNQVDCVTDVRGTLTAGYMHRSVVIRAITSSIHSSETDRTPDLLSMSLHGTVVDPMEVFADFQGNSKEAQTISWFIDSRYNIVRWDIITLYLGGEDRLILVDLEREVYMGYTLSDGTHAKDINVYGKEKRVSTEWMTLLSYHHKSIRHRFHR